MRLFECRRAHFAALRSTLIAATTAIGLFVPAGTMRAEEWLTLPSGKPRIADIRPRLDDLDEAAALEAVQVALTEVGDGSSYVWYRHGGRLSGIVQPTQSFKDTLGRVCRHIVVTLRDVSRQKRTEGIACRLADGAWELDG